jgi:5-methylcytosine-specific restriction enzyme A
MPYAAPRACTRPGCTLIGQHRHGHVGAEGTTARGYGWRWQQLRDRVLREEPLCYYCKAMGFTVAATSVDHMTPKERGGTDARTNLVGACKPCNDAKKDQTADEFLRARKK